MDINKCFGCLDKRVCVSLHMNILLLISIKAIKKVAYAFETGQLLIYCDSNNTLLFTKLENKLISENTNLFFNSVNESFRPERKQDKKSKRSERERGGW